MSARPPPFTALLDAAEVIDICVNPDGAVFVERFGAGWVHWSTLSAAEAEEFLRWCGHVASDGCTLLGYRKLLPE